MIPSAQPALIGILAINVLFMLYIGWTLWCELCNWVRNSRRRHRSKVMKWITGRMSAAAKKRRRKEPSLALNPEQNQVQLVSAAQEPTSATNRQTIVSSDQLETAVLNDDDETAVGVAVPRQKDQKYLMKIISGIHGYFVRNMRMTEIGADATFYVLRYAMLTANTEADQRASQRLMEVPEDRYETVVASFAQRRRQQQEAARERAGRLRRELNMYLSGRLNIKATQPNAESYLKAAVFTMESEDNISVSRLIERSAELKKPLKVRGRWGRRSRRCL